MLALGRFVKRGEKGIMILAPMVGYRRPRQDEIATDIQTDSHRSRVEARNPRADTANVNPAAAIKRNPTT